MSNTDVNPRLWILEILTGKKPAKTSQYNDELYLRREIINLYLKIDRVRFLSRHKPSILINALSTRYDMLEQIQRRLTLLYEKKRKKIKIIYHTSNRLQYQIKEDENLAIMKIYIPIIEDEDI